MEEIGGPDLLELVNRMNGTTFFLSSKNTPKDEN